MPEQLTLFGKAEPGQARVRRRRAAGCGRAKVRPVKAADEVGPAEACAILKCSNSHLNNLVNHLDTHEIIQWRWLGARGQGAKRMYKVESLKRFLKAQEEH